MMMYIIKLNLKFKIQILDFTPKTNRTMLTKPNGKKILGRHLYSCKKANDKSYFQPRRVTNSCFSNEHNFLRENLIFYVNINS